MIKYLKYTATKKYMNKLILKTALITLATFALAALAVFSLWILISPQTMADACEKTGNYSFAVNCADLRYKYTGKTADLARCAEDSILSGKDNLIVKYGEMLISDEGFDELCTRRDDEVVDIGFYLDAEVRFKVYICANLSAAQYRMGSLDNAIKTAETGGSFTKLIIEIIENGTKSDAEKVLEALDGSDENLIKLLEEFINKGV